MKKIFLTFLIFFTQPNFASVCDSFFENEIFKGIDKSKTCALNVKEHQLRAEIIFIRKKCRKQEGDTPKDCYMVRVCPLSSSGETFQSELIFLDQIGNSGKCQKEFKNVLVGSKFEDPRSPVISEIHCQKDKTPLIKLKVKETIIKECEMKF